MTTVCQRVSELPEALNNMNTEKYEDYPFDKDLDEDIDIILGNYGVDVRKIIAEIINEHELNGDNT